MITKDGRPISLVIGGVPTAGKTTLANFIAPLYGWHHIDIDAVAESCVGLSEKNPYATEEGTKREQLRMQIAYKTVHFAVEENLKAGRSIIVTATYSRSGSLIYLRDAVDRGKGRLVLVRCEYNDTPEEIERRIADRKNRGYVGGCQSVEHYLADRNRFEDFGLEHVVVFMQGGDEGTREAARRVKLFMDGRI